MATGIYSITIGGKVYIGQTGAKKGFLARWRQHRSRLAAGTHANKHLQNLWNKHGGEAGTSFDVVEECADELLDEREIFHMAARDPACCIVQAPGGDSPTRGVVRTTEHSRALSKGHGGRPFFCESLETGEVRRFVTQGEAVAEGFQQSHVWACLHGKRATHKKHRFWFDPEVPSTPTPPKQRDDREKRNRVVIGTSIETGETREYPFVAAVERDGFCRTGVYKVLTGEMHQHSGYTWAYADGLPHLNMRPEHRAKLYVGARVNQNARALILVHAERGDVLAFDYIKAASDGLGVRPDSVRSALTGGLCLGYRVRERSDLVALFRDALKCVWGDTTGDLISFQVLGGLEGAAASLSYDSARAQAEGRQLLSWASEHVLNVPDDFTSKDASVLWKLLLHEAIHVGHADHGKGFRRVAAEVGTCVTEWQMAGLGVLIERELSDGSFEYVANVDTFKEAKALALTRPAGPGRYRLTH